MEHNAGKERTDHASGERHERTKSENITQQTGAERNSDGVPRTEINAADDVHKMLNRAALCSQEWEREQRSDHGDCY